jgi:cobalamin biosynthesis protein CobD/CbiB
MSAPFGCRLLGAVIDGYRNQRSLRAGWSDCTIQTVAELVPCRAVHARLAQSLPSMTLTKLTMSS